MKDSTFTIDQITSLRELEKSRVKQGRPGFREEVQSLLQRLCIDDEGSRRERSRDYDLIRTGQATLLFDRGFGKAFKSYDDYLATIPQIPEKLREFDERFPLLILVDPCLDLADSCRRAGIVLRGLGRGLSYVSKSARPQTPYWIRCQEGRRNVHESVEACLAAFAFDELGLTVMEGVALYMQNPGVIEGHDLLLSDSRFGRRGACVTPRLGSLHGSGPALDVYLSTDAGSKFGTASRLK